MVRAAHGLLPNPAPAVVALLEGVPTWGRNVGVELTTPTGAALLAALSSGFGPLPPMRVTGQGFGAGSRDLEELPNCTQVVTGLRVDRSTGADDAPTGRGPTSMTGLANDADSDAGQPLTELAVNVDDATGEQLAHAVGTLLEAGAYDAWLAPVVMKKGRPGTVVHVLCDPATAASFRGLLRETTGSLGVRATSGERWPSARSVDSVWIDGQLIRVKVSAGRVKAEHDDVARAARRSGQPLRDVAFRAEALWRSAQDGPKVAQADRGDGDGPDGLRTRGGRGSAVRPVPFGGPSPAVAPGDVSGHDDPA
jgi:uncharacterized protein (DUF111 family)